MSKIKFPNFSDNRFSEAFQEALRSGVLVVRQIMYRDINEKGEKSERPYRIMLQQLKKRTVAATASSVDIGAVLSGLPSRDLSVYNTTMILNMTEEAFASTFGQAGELAVVGYDATTAENGEVLLADAILGKHKAITGALSIQVTENFDKGSWAGNTPKTRGIGGPTVLASLNGEMKPVYVHEKLTVTGSDNDQFINPNASYSGDAEAPVLQIDTVGSEAQAVASLY